MLINIVGQPGDLGAKGRLIIGIATITVKLNMGQVAPMSFQGLHGLQGGLPISRQTEVVPMNVDRVRQTQSVDRCGDSP